MPRGSIFQAALVALAATALATACQTTQTEDVTPTPDTDFNTGGGLSDSPNIEGTEIPAPSPELAVVYFDFDKSDIRPDQRPKLQSNADAIGSSAWRSVTVEGHCDERGSEEYNLALGERRANSVKRYLVDLGVSSALINTVSFGEARPAVQGHDESAWRYNRRAEFGVNR